MLKAISRDDARAARLTRYFTGEPCKNGHIAERRVCDTDCCECRKSWRAAHFSKNRDHENATRAARYVTSKGAELERKQRYNRERRAERTATQNKRRARKLNATPLWFGEFDDLVLVEAHRLAELRKECTGIEWAVDHMIPLQGRGACGLHVGSNLQVIPAWLNTKKNNRMILIEPMEWLAAI